MTTVPNPRARSPKHDSCMHLPPTITPICGTTLRQGRILLLTGAAMSVALSFLCYPTRCPRPSVSLEDAGLHQHTRLRTPFINQSQTGAVRPCHLLSSSVYDVAFQTIVQVDHTLQRSRTPRHLLIIAMHFHGVLFGLLIQCPFQPFLCQTQIEDSLPTPIITLPPFVTAVA